MSERPIYNDPAATRPVLSCMTPSGGYRRGLVRPASTRETFLMTSGLVPDINYFPTPENKAKNSLFWDKHVNLPDSGWEDTEVIEESFCSGIVHRNIQYSEHRAPLPDDATEEEILAAEQANCTHAWTTIGEMFTSLPETFIPTRLKWGDLGAGCTRLFPVNETEPFTVPHEQFSMSASGTDSFCEAEILHTCVRRDSYDAIVFPGSVGGAKVKARLTIEDVRATSQTGFANSWNPMSTLWLFPALQLFQGNFNLFSNQWPEEYTDQFGNHFEAVSAFDAINLDTMSLQPQDEERFHTQYSLPEFSWDIEFTVPPSRILIPFFALHRNGDAGLQTLASYVRRTESYRTCDFLARRVKLTILQIGTYI